MRKQKKAPENRGFEYLSSIMSIVINITQCSEFALAFVR